MFHEAKSEVKEQEALTERQERVWRARQAFLHKTLEEGTGNVAAHVRKRFLFDIFEVCLFLPWVRGYVLICNGPMCHGATARFVPVR